MGGGHERKTSVQMEGDKAVNKDHPDFDRHSTMIDKLADQMRGTPPPQKTAEQMLIDRIKSLEMDLRESSELNEHLRERMNHLKQELIDNEVRSEYDIKTLQEHKDWLKRRVTQLEDALRRIAYPKVEGPHSAEGYAKIAFEALNHSKP